MEFRKPRPRNKRLSIIKDSLEHIQMIAPVTLKNTR